MSPLRLQKVQGGSPHACTAWFDPYVVLCINGIHGSLVLPSYSSQLKLQLRRRWGDNCWNRAPAGSSGGRPTTQRHPFCISNGLKNETQARTGAGPPPSLLASVSICKGPELETWDLFVWNGTGFSAAEL